MEEHTCPSDNVKVRGQRNENGYSMDGHSGGHSLRMVTHISGHQSLLLSDSGGCDKEGVIS